MSGLFLFLPYRLLLIEFCLCLCVCVCVQALVACNGGMTDKSDSAVVAMQADMDGNNLSTMVRCFVGAAPDVWRSSLCVVVCGGFRVVCFYDLRE